MQLNQKAKARREQGLFVAEGRKMFLEAPESWVSQVFVSETVSRDGELMSQAEKYPCEIVKDSVFRQMCDTKTPQGILTVLKLPSWSEEEVLAGENPLVMVLEDLQDPGNAGTILRTGGGAGVSGVFLTKTCVDITNPKVIRSTMGSIYRMPFLYVEDVVSLEKKLKEKGMDENTLVIFTSDNGPHEEGGADPTFFGRDGKLRGLKRQCHEGGIRIPFIVRWPGKVKAGQVNDHQLAFYDLMPTFCDVAGVKNYVKKYTNKKTNERGHFYAKRTAEQK